jgi:hypothetical protein
MKELDARLARVWAIEREQKLIFSMCGKLSINLSIHSILFHFLFPASG